MRNRILQYGIFTICVSSTVFYTVLFFLFRYDYIVPHQRIESILDWLDLTLGLSLALRISIISLITGTAIGGVFSIIEWSRRRKIGNIIFKFDMKMDKWEWGVATLVMLHFVFTGGAFLVIFLRSPVYYIILYLLSIAVAIFLFGQFLFRGNGITINGIKYDLTYFLWGDILYYRWQEEKNLILELTVQSRTLFWKQTYPISIQVEGSSREEIERLLEGKIKRLE